MSDAKNTPPVRVRAGESGKSGRAAVGLWLSAQYEKLSVLISHTQCLAIAKKSAFLAQKQSGRPTLK